MIGHDIVVTVLSVTRDHVRIGIQAPPHVEVHREEVYLAIQEQNRRSASPTAGAIEGLASVVPTRAATPAKPAEPVAEENPPTSPAG
jgi:carbon storage regulator